MSVEVISCGESRSFPEGIRISASESRQKVLLLTGADAGAEFERLTNVGAYDLVLIELGTECLGTHTGESRGEEGGNVLGFARFRMGKLPPSDLVEIVRQPGTSTASLELARALFHSQGLKTAVSGDFPGRIVDRLIRPYLNAALDRLDARLATAADMDLTIKLGLGHARGPIELLEESGLDAHFEITRALHAALGDPAYSPARRAQVAAARNRRT